MTPTARMSIPNQGDGTGGNVAGDGGGTRRKHDTKSFDMSMFHRLRLERLENQQRAEHRRLQGDASRSLLHWHSASSLQSNTMRTDSSMPTARSRSFQATRVSIEAKAPEKCSARQELLRLGQRYASSQRTAWVNRKGDAQVHKELFPPRMNDIPAPRVSENGDSAVALEKAVIQRTSHFNSHLSSVPIPVKGRTPAVTPDVKSDPKEAAGDYSSHYLLLARANASSATAFRTDHEQSDAIIIDADDGSSAASFHTPTPRLQAASACDSHGENEEGCEIHDDVEVRTPSSLVDHFSSFCQAQILISEEECEVRDDELEVDTDRFSSLCKAQILISEIEEKRSRQLKAVSTCLIETSTQNTHLWKLPKVNFQSIIAAIAAAALLFYWHDIGSRYYQTSARIHHLLAPHLNSWRHSTPVHSWLRAQLQQELYLKFGDGVRQASLLHSNTISVLVFWAKVLRGKVATYTNWMLSLIGQIMHCFEKLYCDALELFSLTKTRFFVVQDSSVVAWNVSLSVAISCWQQLEGVPMSHLFYKSNEHIMIRKATVTTPIMFCQKNDGCISKKNHNQTLVLIWDNADGVNSTNESFPPRFWTRQPLPSMRGTFVRRCIHSIPSLGTNPDGSDFSTTYGRASISPASNELRHSNDLFPVVGLGRSRHSFVSHRLDNITVSSDIRKNIAALMVIQKSRNNARLPRHQHLQTMIPSDTNYYTSSYPTQEQESNEIDLFDDVDVMGMAREFVRHVLQQRFTSKKWRRIEI